MDDVLVNDFVRGGDDGVLVEDDVLVDDFVFGGDDSGGRCFGGG